MVSIHFFSWVIGLIRNNFYSGVSFSNIKVWIEFAAAAVGVIGFPVTLYQLWQIRTEIASKPKLLVGYREPGTSGRKLLQIAPAKPVYKSGESYSSPYPFTFTVTNSGDKTAEGILWNAFVPNPVTIVGGEPYDTSWFRLAYPREAPKIDLNPGEELPVEIMLVIPKGAPKFKFHVRLTMVDSPLKDYWFSVDPS